MHCIDEEFAPALSQQPGFVGYFALDIGGGAIETINVFHDTAAAEQSNELAAAYVAENLGEFELTRTDVTASEVCVSRTAPTALDNGHRCAQGVPARGPTQARVLSAPSSSRAPPAGPAG